MWKKGHKQSKETIEKRIKSRKRNGWFRNPKGSKKKMSNRQLGNKNSCWKGNNIKYSGIHKWLVKSFGKATKCENVDCKKISKRFEWALRKGFRHKRKREHYFQLCHSCHQSYDYTQERRDKISASNKITKNRKTPRPYLSWSQLNLWERDPELYRRTYLDGLKQFENQYLKVGKALHTRLESGVKTDNELIEHLALFMSKYEKREFEIKVDFKGILILGRLDCFNRKGCVIGEVKTGRHLSQSVANKSGQLTFYSALVWLKYHRLPQEIRLHWAQTELNEDGDLQLTGQMKTFITHRTLSDIILLRGRIKKAWEGIIKMCN